MVYTVCPSFVSWRSLLIIALSMVFRCLVTRDHRVSCWLTANPVIIPAHLLNPMAPLRKSLITTTQGYVPSKPSPPKKRRRENQTKVRSRSLLVANRIRTSLQRSRSDSGAQKK